MNATYTARGRLQISALENRGAEPVRAAVVQITDPSNGMILKELTTDSSGQTDTVELPAPSVAYSIAETEERPYATYNVNVRAAGYRTIHIGGVQLLPDELSLQGISMERASPGGFNVTNYQIAPHTLWGEYPAKIPEDEVKPLPKSDGFVVLSKPVIPEFIVVHLGVPEDRTAKNMWVYFRDYIKNVASSEIYATWTEETIKANVLAILSFTLNRVYTEWYRGKGYDFTVTNSTAYDQAFVPERTIFEPISRVVDDLFTTYITREGAGQPLLTQYCDGRRVQCKGLSQWGSQALGEQGFSAMEILRRYYGGDIYLDKAEKVKGVPLSYGGEVLTTGSSGEAVRTIQRQLNRIGKNFPAIPRLAADGVYGKNTEEAVKVFQKVFHLPESGSVDFATWYAISNAYVAVSGLAE